MWSASPYADFVNRGKRSFVLDLKEPQAVEAVLALVAHADVLFEGHRPGVAGRLGLGPDAVWARNPRTVDGRMTGWGQDGPLASSAGHDIGFIAVTGALGAMGDPSVPPQIPLNLVGDFGGGSMFLVTGILAALLDVERTGRGQIVDAAVVDGVASLLGPIHAMLATDSWVDERGENLLDVHGARQLGRVASSSKNSAPSDRSTAPGCGPEHLDGVGGSGVVVDATWR